MSMDNEAFEALATLSFTYEGSENLAAAGVDLKELGEQASIAAQKLGTTGGSGGKGGGSHGGGGSGGTPPFNHALGETPEHAKSAGTAVLELRNHLSEAIESVVAVTGAFMGLRGVLHSFADTEDTMDTLNQTMEATGKFVSDAEEKLTDMALETGTGMAVLGRNAVALLQTYARAEDTAKLLEIANETAIGSSTSLDSTVRFLTKSMALFGDASVEAAEKTTNLATHLKEATGVGLEQYANVLNRLGPNLRTLGADQKDMYVLFTTLNNATGDLQGSLRGLYSIIPALNGRGKDFREVLKGMKEGTLEAQVNAKGLTQTIIDIAEAAQKAGKPLKNVFGERGAPLVAKILEQKDEVKSTNDLADAVERGDARLKAYETRVDSVRNSLNRLGEAGEAIASQIGSNLADELVRATDAITEFTKAMTAFDNEHDKMVSSAASMALMAVSVLTLGGAIFKVWYLWVELIKSFPLVLTLGKFIMSAVGYVKALILVFSELGTGGVVVTALSDLLVLIGSVVASIATWPVAIGVALTAAAIVLWKYRDQWQLFADWFVALMQELVATGKSFVSLEWMNFDESAEGTVFSRFMSRLTARTKALQDARREAEEYAKWQKEMADTNAMSMEDGSMISGLPSGQTPPEVKKPGGGGGNPDPEDAKRAEKFKTMMEQLREEAIAVQYRTEAYKEGYVSVQEAMVQDEVYSRAKSLDIKLTYDQATNKWKAVDAGQDMIDTIYKEVSALKLHGETSEEVAKSVASYNDSLHETMAATKAMMASYASGGLESYRDEARYQEALNEILKVRADLTRDAAGHNLVYKQTGKELNEQDKELVATYVNGAAASREFADAQDHLNKLWSEGRPLTFMEGVRKGIDGMTESLQTVGEVTDSVLTDTLTSGVDALADTLMTNSKSFSEWANSVVASIGKVILKWLMMKAIMGMLNAISGSATSTANGSIGASGIGGGTDYDVADGLVAFDQQNAGMTYDVPTAASEITVAPEVSDARMDVGAYGPRSAAASGGHQAKVTVIHNNYAKGVEAETSEREGPNGERIIEILTKQVTGKIIEDSANGGGLESLFKMHGAPKVGTHR